MMQQKGGRRALWESARRSGRPGSRERKLPTRRGQGPHSYDKYIVSCGGFSSLNQPSEAIW
ncbi:uncharacterized protein P884DRAFT_255980 [Thermothelomyces heterothallicus CBS 202.75]|uniref:uncharacterized protein n=1 Tax=Thermothelomyces heterothallicus CBS 202.75 TaxID=1149848 RepID=UPI003742EC04